MIPGLCPSRIPTDVSGLRLPTSRLMMIKVFVSGLLASGCKSFVLMPRHCDVGLGGVARFSTILTRASLLPHSYGFGRVSRFISMKQDRSSGRKMTPHYIPKTENQRQFVAALNDPTNQLVVVLGPAGTGKTLFACVKAIQDLKAGLVQKIVITRPVVTVDEDIGYLPGSMRNKMDPWMRPIFDIFLEYYCQRDIDSMIQSGVIEISPLAFMRGRTFKKCFILADEMQNSSPNQMLMLITRIGDGSRMVVGGDLNQSDRDRDSVGGAAEKNGLAEFVFRFRRYCGGSGNTTGISLCEFDSSDVERSPIVAKLLDIFVGPITGIKPRNIEVVPVASPDCNGSSHNSSNSTPHSYGYFRTSSSHNSSNDSAIIPKKDFYPKNPPIW